MDDILNIILKDTFTLTQLKTRVRVLKSNLLKTFFGGETKLTLSPQDLSWLKSLPPSFYQQFTKDNVYKIFVDLENKIQNLKLLTIYLTFEPDDVVVKEIGIMVRKTFGSFLPLDIKYDPTLIAGCALVWKGVYRDYSLRAKIEERKGEILEGFKKFLR